MIKIKLVLIDFLNKISLLDFLQEITNFIVNILYLQNILDYPKVNLKLIINLNKNLVSNMIIVYIYRQKS